MLDCIKKIKHRARVKPKNSPWSLFIPNMFHSSHDPILAYDYDTQAIIATNKVKGKGHGKFPKGKLK